MADAMTTRVRSATTWSIALSVLMIVVGLLAMAVPAVAGIAVTAFVGWLLVISGIAHLVFSWRSGTAGAVIWELLLGLAYGAIGFYLVTRPVVGLASLTLALAIYLFVEAVLEFALSYQLRSHSGSGWLLFDGIVTLILSAMIWMTWPASTVWVVGTLVGVSMLFSGISRLMLSLAVRRAIA
jgi:uncharacterized membrane protein HdeD (DUF308 family)